MKTGIGRFLPNDPEIMEEMEKAEGLDHSANIRGYRLNIDVDHNKYSGKADSVKQFIEMEKNVDKVTFRANRAGSFDITCANSCGYGHPDMIAKGALVVTA